VSKEDALMTPTKVNEQTPSSPDILTLQEQTTCKQITEREAPHRQRALALLALQNGSTQAQAAQQSGLTQGQVKYWLAQFRKQRLAIFPGDLLNGPDAKQITEAVDSAEKETKRSEEKTVKAGKAKQVKKDKKDKKDKMGKKSKESEKKSEKPKMNKKEKKEKKKKKGKNDKKKK